jgi:hypothetical protein
MSIPLPCRCGKQLRVPEEHVGRRVRCPTCGETLTVPSSEEAAAPLNGLGQARSASDGTAVGQGLGKKRLALPLVLAGVVALVVLGGGGLGDYLFFNVVFGSRAPDLELVPADAQGFVRVRLAEVWTTGLMRKAARRAKEKGEGEGPEELLRDAVGLVPADVERLTVVLVDAKQGIGWAVLATARAYDRQAVLGRLPGGREVQHEGKSYQVGTTANGSELAVFFAAKRVLVVGPEAGVRRCLSFLAGDKPQGPLTDALRRARGRDHLVAAGNPAPEQIRLLKNRLEGAGSTFLPLAEARAVTLVVNVGESVRLEASLKFDSAGGAEKGRKVLDLGLKAAPLLLRDDDALRPRGLPIHRALEEDDGPRWDDFQVEPLLAALESLQVRQQGAEVVVDGQTDAADQVYNVALLLSGLRRVAGGPARRR